MDFSFYGVNRILMPPSNNSSGVSVCDTMTAASAYQCIGDEAASISGRSEEDSHPQKSHFTAHNCSTFTAAVLLNANE